VGLDDALCRGLGSIACIVKVRENGNTHRSALTAASPVGYVVRSVFRIVRIKGVRFMKKHYERMKVTLVATLKNVVEKSGGYPDNSTNYTDKTFDNGRGNG
jgi:hypothetical protein